MYSKKFSVIPFQFLLLVFAFVLFTSVAAAAPETTDTPEISPKLPAILILPVIDNTGLKNPHEYMAEAMNANYAAKYPKEQFAVIPFQKYSELVNGNDESQSQDKFLKAATAAGADYVIRTELQKVEIRRGVKGIFLKKWCSADIPVKITIWNAASGKTVFDGVIQARGDKENGMGLAIGLLLSVSEEATIKDGLTKIGNRMDNELPPLK